MEKEKLVSIIIPVYNVKSYLSEALDSVLHQTYQKLEILVIDDGSTDGSGAICDEYQKIDNRIIVVHQENKGLSSARNTGLNMMKGEAVAFLDSDDALQPTYVQTMLDVMNMENADIVICKYTSHDTDGIMRALGNEQRLPLIDKGSYDRKSAFYNLIDGKMNHIVWNKLYRSELWKNVRFPDGRVYEDRTTTFQVLDLCEKMVVIDDPLYLYRVRVKSISNTYSRKNISDKILSRWDFNRYIERHIPDMFTENHLDRDRQLFLDAMILDYIGFSKATKNQEKEFKNDIRNQIIALGKKVNLKQSNLMTRVGYRLIYCAPAVLILTYSLYLRIQKVIHKEKYQYVQ